MQQQLNYTELAGYESYGSAGLIKSFGVKIMLAAIPTVDLEQNKKLKKALRTVSREAIDKLIETYQLEVYRQDSKFNAEIKQELKELKALFPTLIFVEEIPNGYSQAPFYSLIPWLRVTTTIGHFVIGWRKRVISIDWSATVNTPTAYDLFADEDVTKGERSIHADNIEKAQQYVSAILQSTQPTN